MSDKTTALPHIEFEDTNPNDFTMTITFDIKLAYLIVSPMSKQPDKHSLGD